MLANIPLLGAQMAGPGGTERMTEHPETSISRPWWTSEKEERWCGPAPLPHPQIPHLPLRQLFGAEPAGKQLICKARDALPYIYKRSNVQEQLYIK